MRIAVYPGSFDPITNGHIDIISRASHIFDKVIVVVMVNYDKKTVFTEDERISHIKKVTHKIPNVEVDYYGGLLANYAKMRDATAIIKGLRAVSDFEYEFQMALANRHLNPMLETVFLMTSQMYMYLSSSMVKDIARHSGDISNFIAKEIYNEVVERLQG